MKERLTLFAKTKGISIRALEQQAGWTNGTVCNLKLGIRSDKLADLARAFPDLNIRWLLTGEGTMFGEDPVPVVKVEDLSEMGKQLLTEQEGKLLDLFSAIRGQNVFLTELLNQIKNS